MGTRRGGAVTPRSARSASTRRSGNGRTAGGRSSRPTPSSRGRPSRGRRPRRRRALFFFPGPPRRSASPLRLMAMFVMIVGAFGLMASRLFVLQVVESRDFQRIAANQRQNVIEFPGRRGAILDRDGNTLAISVDMQTISADPTLIDDPIEAATRLGRVLDM